MRLAGFEMEAYFSWLDLTGRPVFRVCRRFKSCRLPNLASPNSAAGDIQDTVGSYQLAVFFDLLERERDMEVWYVQIPCGRIFDVKQQYPFRFRLP